MPTLPSIFELVKRLGEVFSCAQLTADWLPLSLAYVRVKKLPYPRRVCLRTGEVVVLRELTDLIVFWLIFVRRHYPVDPSDGTIVDVGANIGMFTLYAARTARSATIIAVEPFPDTCERLKETIRMNHLEGRVTVVRCAVTGFKGAALMDVSAGVPSQYRSVLSEVPRMLNEVRKGHSQPDGGISVPTLTLAELLARHSLSRMDLLKMNIHGNEYEVLLASPDSALRRFHRIALQYHVVPESMGLSKNDLFQRLESAGFRLTADADTGRGAGRAILALASRQHAPNAARAGLAPA